MKLLEKIKKMKEEINIGKINASSVNAMNVSGDTVSVNNEYGYFEIGDYIGKTVNVKFDKHILIFKGGILVDIKEEGE